VKRKTEYMPTVYCQKKERGSLIKGSVEHLPGQKKETRGEEVTAKPSREKRTRVKDLSNMRTVIGGRTSAA